jgi:hypothetical protein
MRVWAGLVIGPLVLAALGLYWWRDYARQRLTGAPAHVQRLRVLRLCGLGLFVIGLPWRFHRGPFLWQVLVLVGTLGLGLWIVVVTSVVLAAHRRYPGLVRSAAVLGSRGPHKEDVI